MHPDQSSISDYQGYRAICSKSANDTTVFNTFRRDEHYTAILEFVSVEQ